MVQGTGPVRILCLLLGLDNPLGAPLVNRDSREAQGHWMEPMAGVGVYLALDCILLGNFADEYASILCRAGSLNRGSITAHAHSRSIVGHKWRTS